MQPQDPINPNPLPIVPPENNVQQPTQFGAPQQPLSQPPAPEPVAMPATPDMQQPVGSTVAPVMPQEPIAQPQNQSMPQPQYAQQPYVATDDPGKTLSILGICLFIIPIIGISLSIIGMMKSKQAGYSGRLGKIGVGTNIVSIVLSLIIFIILPVLFTKNAADKLAQDVASRTTQTQATSKTTPSSIDTSGLVVGASKADVTKSLGMEPAGCVKMSDTSERCAYRDGSGGSNSTILVNATFVNGKLDHATGFTDSGAKAINVGS